VKNAPSESEIGFIFIRLLRVNDNCRKLEINNNRIYVSLK